MAEIASFGVNVDQNTRLAQNAQDTANKADTGIGDLNDPNLMSVIEKQTQASQYAGLTSQYNVILARAKEDNISATALTTAYTNLNTFMAAILTDTTKASGVNRDSYMDLTDAYNMALSNVQTALGDSYNADIDNMQSSVSVASQAASSAVIVASQANTTGNNASQVASQAVVVASQAQTTGDNATSVANNASQAASSAVIVASQATVTGNQASTAASDASVQASVAISNANAAQSSAMAAVNQAGFASDTSLQASQAASSALASAMSAESNASSAVSIASSTASGFGKVDQKADSAFDNAMNAQSAASDAVEQASSATTDSKDAKQIAGAVSQSYKTLTDGSTMTIAELENGLAAKLTKTDLDGYATQTWTQNKIKVTADDISGNLSSVKKTVDGQATSINGLKADSSGFKSQFTKVNNTLGKQNTDIGTLQATSKSLSANFDSLSSDNKTNQHDIGQLQASAKGFSSTLETVQTQVNNSAVGTNLLTGTADHIVTGSGSNANGYLSNETNDDFLSLFQGLEGQTVTLSVDYKYSGFVAGSDRNRLGWETRIVADSKTLHFGPWYYPNNDSGSGRIFSTFVVPKNITSIGYATGYIQFSGSGTGTLSHLKLEKGTVATDWCLNPEDQATVTALTQVKQTADGAQVLATNNKGDITNLQATAKGLQTSVSNAATKDQLNILSDTFSNKISSATSAANSKMIQTINNVGIGFTNTDGSKFQMNLSADGTALMDFSKIMLNGQTNIQAATIGNAQIANGAINQAKIANAAIGSAQIANGAITNAKIGNLDAGKITTGTIDFNTITGKNINASNITTGKLNTDRLNVGKLSALSANLGDVTTGSLKGVDIVANTFSTPNGSFTTDSNGAITAKNMTINGGTLTSPTINAGKIHGISVTSSLLDISGDGTGPDYDKNTGHEASPDTSQGIYSRYSYSTTSGYDSKAFGRKIFKNGYLSISGDTYLNRAIVDWSADGGGVYSYDQMVQANALKMRAYNFTGTNSQTDNPSDTEGTLSSRIDITPSTISMGTNWSVSDPNVKISSNGTAVFNTVGTKNIVLNSAHTLEVSDGKDLYFSDSTGKQNFSLHAQKFIQSSLLSLKTDITAIDPHDALNEVVKNDVLSYHYKTDDPSKPKSVSVILDDVNQIPEYYTSNIFKSADGTGRNDGNIVGYLMLSIKDLNSRLQKLEGAN